MKIDGAGAISCYSYTCYIRDEKERTADIVKIHERVCGIFGMGMLGYSECLWILQDNSR